MFYIYSSHAYQMPNFTVFKLGFVIPYSIDMFNMHRGI